MAIIFSFLLFVDGIIFNIIDWIYDIFNYLAGLNLFKESVYMDIVQRIYVILGMVMLFILAYTLLKAVVNPDTFAKGEQSFPKLIQNVLVSLVIIVLLPTVFSVAYNVQNSILNYDTIPKLILGANANDYTATNSPDTFQKSQGKKMALYIFSSVFHENAGWCSKEKGIQINSSDFKVVGDSECATEINGDGWIMFTNGTPLDKVSESVQNGESDFVAFKSFSESVRDGAIEYFPIVSTIIGIFTAYVLVNYCFDMALRVIKLMFFQIIAPVPVICRILPGGKMKDVFSDWVKKTISTFVEVFIRIAIIYLGVFLINEIVVEFPNLPNGGLSFTQLLVCKVLLIMGVVIFIRQAPKLISEMFHLDSGSMKLGIMDKLAMGGALTAGAAVGGAITGFGRNMVTAGKNVKNAKGFGGKAKALLSGAGSTIAGGMSAGARAGWTGKGAKNIGDVKNATSKGATGAAAAKAKRDNYKARVNTARANHEFATGLGLRLKDKMDSAGQYFGFDSLDDLKKEQKLYDDIVAIDDRSDSVAVELISRDAFSGSASFMVEASGGTYKMGLAAMKERLQQARNSEFSSVQGKTLTDFKGKTKTINDENDFAQYLADMSSQQAEAERKAKKFIKQLGYDEAGKSRIEAMGIDLGDGELQRMAKLASDRDDMEYLVSQNLAGINQLNAGINDPAARVTQITSDGSAYDLADQLTNNAKNRKIKINAEINKREREKAQRGGGSDSK